MGKGKITFGHSVAVLLTEDKVSKNTVKECWMQMGKNSKVDKNTLIYI